MSEHIDFTVIDEAVATLSAMSEKVLLNSPSWTELADILTEDELAMFFAFVAIMRRRRPEGWDEMMREGITDPDSCNLRRWRSKCPIHADPS